MSPDNDGEKSILHTDPNISAIIIINWDLMILPVLSYVLLWVSNFIDLHEFFRTGTYGKSLQRGTSIVLLADLQNQEIKPMLSGDMRQIAQRSTNGRGYHLSYQEGEE